MSDLQQIAEDVELVALLRRAIADPGQFCPRDRWPDKSGIATWEYESIPAWGARAAGIALANTGLLVPPGGHSWQEWIPGNGLLKPYRSPEAAQHVAATFAVASPLKVRTVTSWSDGTMLTGPWREVAGDA